MLCFCAFGNVPYKDVAIMTRRQHYPGIKRMGLQDKYFICMALEFIIAHHMRTRGHKSTSILYLQQSLKHCTILSSHTDFWKIRPLQAASKNTWTFRNSTVYLSGLLPMAHKQGKPPCSQKDFIILNLIIFQIQARTLEIWRFCQKTVNYSMGKYITAQKLLLIPQDRQVQHSSQENDCSNAGGAASSG